MPGFEHGENAGDAVARQAEFGRFRSVATIIVVIIIVLRNAERQHLAHRRVGELIVHPGCDPFRLRDPGDGPVGELGQPAADGDGVLGRQGGSVAHEGHVDRYASPIDVLERPVLLPFLARQGSRPAIDLAHRLDVLARVAEKALPFLGMLAGRRALDAEQLDQLLAVCLLAGAAERARGAFEIGRQVGDAGLDHWIDDALRRQEGKSEGGVIPDGGIKARIPRGEQRAAREGGAKIVRRVVPIEDRAVGMPGERRCVADGIGQNDRARCGLGDVPESSDGLQVDFGFHFKVDPADLVGGKGHDRLPDAPATRLHGGRRRRRRLRRRRRTAQRHPIDDREQRRPDPPVLGVLVDCPFRGARSATPCRRAGRR